MKPELKVNIKYRLGANYIENTEYVLEDIINDMIAIACDASNRKENDEKIIPYVKKAVIAEYLQRRSRRITFT